MSDTSTPRSESGVNMDTSGLAAWDHMPGGEWDRDDAELGALLFVARSALVSARVKAETMGRRGQGAVKARQLKKAQGALDRIKNDLDTAWVATRPPEESGPTPFYPTRERLPKEAQAALKAVDELGRVRGRRVA